MSWLELTDDATHLWAPFSLCLTEPSEKGKRRRKGEDSKNFQSVPPEEDVNTSHLHRLRLHAEVSKG